MLIRTFPIAVLLAATGLVAATGVLAGCGAAARAPGAVAPVAEAGRPSFLLVSLDTLRGDRLGAVGHPGGLTPNLDRLARESVSFEHTYSQATQTLHSHASLFTSRYPTEIGDLTDTSRVGWDGIPMLPEVLKAYGYTTFASTGGIHLHPSYGWPRGYDAYEMPRNLGSLYHTAPPLLRWLDGLDPGAPFFAFLHTYDVHHRYIKPTPFSYLDADPRWQGPGEVARRIPDGNRTVADGVFYRDADAPAAWARLQIRAAVQSSAEGKAALARELQRASSGTEPFTERDARQFTAGYDSNVRYLDTRFGLLMADLDDRGVLDRAWLIVFSDHGEQLGEDGIWQHARDCEDWVTRVVLIVRPPGGLPGGRQVRGVTELVDVMPTVLDLAGARPPAIVRGTSLVPWIRGEPAGDPHAEAFTQGAVASVRSLTARVSLDGVPPWSGYAAVLAAAAPLGGARLKVSPGAPAREGERLRDALVARLRSLKRRPVSTEADLPEDLVRELRRSGYWDRP